MPVTLESTFFLARRFDAYLDVGQLVEDRMVALMGVLESRRVSLLDRVHCLSLLQEVTDVSAEVRAISKELAEFRSRNLPQLQERRASSLAQLGQSLALVKSELGQKVLEVFMQKQDE